MSHETYLWIKLVHYLGFIVWLGSMYALLLIVRAPAGRGEETGGPLAIAARRAGLSMDIGATLTIAVGVYLLFKAPEPVSPLEQPYFHVKLTLAVALIGLHGYLRARAGKLARGTGGAPPAAVVVIAAVLMLGILAAVLVGPVYMAR